MIAVNLLLHLSNYMLIEKYQNIKIFQSVCALLEHYLNQEITKSLKLHLLSCVCLYEFLFRKLSVYILELRVPPDYDT